MLTQVAEGVWVHESEFLQSNSIVVQGADGVVLVDPGLRDDELTALADDLPGPVVAGFSTHPDWDHLIWHARFGEVPRYATAACVAAVEEQLTDPDLKTKITEHLEPTGLAGHVPLDLYGRLTALPASATHIPWDGPRLRIIEHRAHAPGHAALLIEDRRVLLAGDMLSDIFIPMLDLDAPGDPVEDYLDALRRLADVAGDVDLVVPGHGSAGAAGPRIERDRAYVLALRDGRTPDDPRIGPAARPGWEWVTDIHDGQARRLAERNDRT